MTGPLPGGNADDRPGPAGPDPETEGSGDPSGDDPAYRAARWAMVLAPIVLAVLVFLLLRYSTG